MGIQDREHLEVSRVDQLVAWLKKNHENSPGLWVVTYKKVAKKPSPSYDEIVRAALRFGWVDSLPGKVDEVRTKLYIAPRKAGSSWSQANKLRVDDLTKAGLMEPAGEAVVAASTFDVAGATIFATGALRVVTSFPVMELKPRIDTIKTRSESATLEDFLASSAAFL